MGFLWLIIIQLTDSGLLPSKLDQHLVEEFGDWVQSHTIFEPFEVEWISQSKNVLSHLLEMFETATESVKCFCASLDVPSLEPLFHIKRNLSRLLHFNKEHKRANGLLLESVNSAFTCYFKQVESTAEMADQSEEVSRMSQEASDRCCEFVSTYSLQTLQFAYNQNGIKPTLDSHIERLHAMKTKPKKLVKLYAECAEVALNKKWPTVATYFVELSMKYFFGHSPCEDVRSHFESLLWMSLTNDETVSKPIQSIHESQKPYFAVLLCVYLEIEKELDEVVSVYEHSLTSDFGISNDASLLFLWSSYLSFLVRYLKLNKSTLSSSSSQGDKSSNFQSDKLINPSQTLGVLFQRAVKQCRIKSDRTLYSRVNNKFVNNEVNNHLECCESYGGGVEHLGRLVLPNLALEPRLNMIEWLLEQFPSNIYLLRMYEVASRYNLRGAHVKCTSMLDHENIGCIELVQTTIQMCLQLDDLSQALLYARAGRHQFPFAAGFWCQELVIVACGSESCQHIPKVVQMALEKGGLELNEFLAPVLSSV